MLAQKVCGFIVIIWGLGFIFFAQRIFDFFIQRPGAKTMGVERWPAWMYPTHVWCIRIGGVIGVLGGLALIFTDR